MEFLTKGQSPVIDSWPLMSSPAPMITIFVTYLYFVLKVGPKYMKNRKPFELGTFIRCYNVFQIIACIAFLKWAFNRGFSITSTFTCVRDRTDYDELLDLYNCNWKFIVLRLIELIETIVFVMRKKQNQVSALHVYHHISTAGLLWIFLKFGMNEMGIYSCALNSMVHVVMYSYYFLTSFKSLIGPLKVIKPMITIIQLAQLVMIFANTVVALQPGCQTTKLYYLNVVNMTILIGFFTKFYIENFVKSHKKTL